MVGSFTPEQRNQISRAVRQRADLVCPACGAQLVQQAITPRADVPYVRHRVLVICPACRRSASLDAPPR